MSEPQSGKIYVPVDLRRMNAVKAPIVFQIDDEEEPPCVVMGIFSGPAHVEIKLDEQALEFLQNGIMKQRIELGVELTQARRAARALRRKK